MIYFFWLLNQSCFVWNQAFSSVPFYRIIIVVVVTVVVVVDIFALEFRLIALEFNNSTCICLSV